jgi:hypothetical protein
MQNLEQEEQLKAILKPKIAHNQEYEEQEKEREKEQEKEQEEEQEEEKEEEAEEMEKENENGKKEKEEPVAITDNGRGDASLSSSRLMETKWGSFVLH